MKHMKKLLKAVVAIGIMSIVSITAFAAEESSTAAEAAGPTGKMLNMVTRECFVTGYRFRTIATKAVILEKYQEDILTLQKEMLASQATSETKIQYQMDNAAQIPSKQIANEDSILGSGLGNESEIGTKTAWVDNDGDGVCDNYGSNGSTSGLLQGQGNGSAWADNDENGICDNYEENGNRPRQGQGRGAGRGWNR